MKKLFISSFLFCCIICGQLTAQVELYSELPTMDTINIYDKTGYGIFGRKVTYKDNTATLKAVNQVGTISIKVCVNQGGNITYAELLSDETTIKDTNTLELFLKSAYKWKFQPDLTAPKEQCGKFKFKIDNSANNKLIG